MSALKKLWLLIIFLASCNAVETPEQSYTCDAVEADYDACEVGRYDAEQVAAALDSEAAQKAAELVQAKIERDQWRNEALRIGKELELRTAQLEGVNRQIAEATNILFSECPNSDELYSRMVEAGVE